MNYGLPRRTSLSRGSGVTGDPSRLTGRTFDLLIVGGGIVGTGIAWDASLRGLTCALLEQGDFASGTSSKTTKLIHGGIRYLESGEFKLVREAIRERQLLLKNASSLVTPLRFLIPVVGNSPRPWPYVWLGVSLYDFLAGKNVIEPHRFFRQDDIQAMEAILSGSPAKRAAGYTDAQMDDSRLVLEVVKAASKAGAVVAHYVKVVQWIQENGRIVGTVSEDLLTGRRYEVRAHAVINATGPWVDRLRKLADPLVQPIVRPSKGIHLVYPDLGLKHALVLSASDRRIFFLIPWKGLTLIGTTDTDFSDDPQEAHADQDDVEYLIRETNRCLPKLRIERQRVLSTFAGVRSLVFQEKKDPWAVSRSHLIHEDTNGLVSIVGGKFTTFRKIAEEVVDLVVKRFPQKRLGACQTDRQSLGEQAERVEWIRRWVQADRRWAQPICPHHPFTLGDLRYAVEEEMAITLSDLLFRRLGIAWSVCQGLDAAQTAAEAMGDLLGWSKGERRRQLDRYRTEL